MASQLKVVCPHCQKKVLIPRSSAEGESECPNCKGKIKILIGAQATQASSVPKSTSESKPASTQKWWTVRKSLSLLQDKDPHQRRAAAENLASLGDSRALEPLAEALTDRDPSVRKSVAAALEKLGWANTLRRQVHLAVAAGDWDKLVSLGRSVTSILLELIPRQSAAVQSRLIEVIGLLGDRDAVEPLHGFLKQKYVRSAAYRALHRLADPRSQAACQEFAETSRSAIEQMRDATVKLMTPSEAKVAVAKAQQLLENFADLLPCEMLLQLTELDRVEALVTITLPGDHPVSRTEAQTVRCVAIQRLVLEEIARREVDPKNNGLAQVQAGNEAYARGDYTTALDQFSQAVELNDSLLVAHHNRGCVLAATQKWDRALVDFNHAVDLDPTAGESLLERARLYHAIGNFHRAREDYTAAFQLGETVEALIGRGRVYLDSGQADRAVEDFEAACAVHATTPVLNELGVALYRLGRFQDAVERFTQALAQQESVDVLWNRAIALCGRRRYEQALQDLDRIESLDDKAAVFHVRGNVLLALGKYEEAAQQYRQHLAERDNPMTRLNLGVAYQMLRMPQEAIEQYNIVLSVAAELSVAWNNRGLAHRALGRLDLAIADFDKAIELDSDYSPGYNNRGMAYQASRRFEEALEDFRSAIGTDPLNAVAFRNRSLLYLRTNSPQEAKADYETALSLEPALAFPI